VQILGQYGMKRRIEWSALLLFVLGLCSLAAPHKMVHATVHHRPVPSSGSTSRTQRPSGRSARGGLRTEMDEHGLKADVASQGVRPRETQSAVVAVDAAVVAPRFLIAPSFARGELPPTGDDFTAVSYDVLPSRGRAPPTL
jgi:hypothetical protein